MQEPPFKDKTTRDLWQMGGEGRGENKEPKATAAMERHAAKMRGITVAEYRKLKRGAINGYRS